MRSPLASLAFACLAVCVPACSCSTPRVGPGDVSFPDASAADAAADAPAVDASALDGGIDGAARDAGRDAFAADTLGPCATDPMPADGTRYVVVANPFEGADGQYEVLRLSDRGVLGPRTGVFTMGKAYEGEIAFSLDGRVGVAAQDDGTLGIFALAPDGTAIVIDPGYDGTAYAARVVADPAEPRVFWVLDSQTRNNGAGVYRLSLDCHGGVIDETLAIAADLPYAMGFESSGDAVVIARAMGATGARGDDVYRVDLSTAAVLGSADVFPDDEWIVSGFALGDDHVFFGDNAGFSSVPNRLGVAALAPIGFAQNGPAVDDPIALLLSPFGDHLLVVDGFGNAFFDVPYDAAAAMPLGTPVELTYNGPRPQLPGGAVMITRGALTGLGLVSENVAIRVVRFQPGMVIDVGPYSLDGAIAGAIGVQP